MYGVMPSRVRNVIDWSNWSGTEVATGDRYVDTEFVGSRWTGMHHDKNAGALEDLGVVNCMFRWGDKWLSRMYRVRQALFDRCTFMDVLQEHAIYWNIAGGHATHEPSDDVNIHIRRCHFHNISSQAIQMVGSPDRAGETPEPEEDASPGLGIKVSESLFQNIGARTGHTRASFALSFFQTPNDVWLEDVILNNRMQPTSRGALLCERRDTPRSRLFVNHSYFHTGKLEQPMAKIEDTKEVILHDTEFIARRGGQSWIDIKGAEKLRITECGGNVMVRRNGQDLGMIETLDIKEI